MLLRMFATGSFRAAALVVAWVVGSASMATGCARNAIDPAEALEARLPFDGATFAKYVSTNAVAAARDHGFGELRPILESADADFEDFEVFRVLLDDLYTDANAPTVFVADGMLTDLGREAIEAISTAESHALDPSTYWVDEINALVNGLLRGDEGELWRQMTLLEPDEVTLLDAYLMNLAEQELAPTSQEALFDLVTSDSPNNPVPEYAARYRAIVDRVVLAGETALQLELWLASATMRWGSDLRWSNAFNYRERIPSELVPTYIVDDNERREPFIDGVRIEDELMTMDSMSLEALLYERGAEFFVAARDGADPAELVAGLQPPAHQYPYLVEAYDRYRQVVESGGWPVLERGRLRVGDDSDVTPALRERLTAEGYWDGYQLYEEEFTADLQRALQEWQRDHNLDDSGRLDSETREAINVPAERRLAEVALTMERWRESRIGSDFDDYHIWVNVTGFYGEMWREGEPVHDWRVVVGRDDWRREGDRSTSLSSRTPLFSDVMEDVIFNPYWYIPQSIVQGEIISRYYTEGYDYLAARGYELMRETPTTIYVRQRPGSGNALGRVKFMFYNPFNVYMHDTPSRSLFNHRNRAYSHGCVRVHDPLELAAQIVAYDRDMTLEQARDYVDDEVDRGLESPYELRTPIPVHIEYYLVTASEDGLVFHGDVYDYEEELLDELEQELRDRYAPITDEAETVD